MCFYLSQFQAVADILSQLCATYVESHPNYPRNEEGSLRALKKIRTEIYRLIKSPQKCTLEQYKKLININIKAAMPPQQMIIKISSGFLGFHTSSLTLSSDLYVLIQYLIDSQNKIIAELEAQENRETNFKPEFLQKPEVHKNLNDEIEAAIGKFIITVSETIQIATMGTEIKKEITSQKAILGGFEAQWAAG